MYNQESEQLFLGEVQSLANQKKRMKSLNVVSIKLVKERTMSYETKKCSSSTIAAKILQNYIGEADREHFVAIALDTKLNVNAIQTISIGSLNSAIVHPREVFKFAILSNANSILVGHQHPTGDPTPSDEDIKITQRLIETGKVIGIDVVDHIILGDSDRYLSMRDQNKLSF